MHNKQLLQAWPIKIIHEYVNIQQHISDNNKSFKDVADYVKDLTSNDRDSQSIKAVDKGFIRKPVRKCPNCGGVLKLFSTTTGCKWECCKTCTKGPCGYIEHVDKDIEEYIKEYDGK